MSTKYDLDYRVALSEDTESKNLYKWCLQEFDNEGNKVGRDQIPWRWTLYFTAMKFSHKHTLSMEKSAWKPPLQEFDYEETSNIQEREYILAELRPGNPHQDIRDTNSYSMIGTKRTITSFRLYIYPSKEEEEKEDCKVTGHLSFTSQIEIYSETFDDDLHINIAVSPDRFAQLAERVKRRDFDIATLSLNRVAGFYSSWEPGISTDKVKVLTTIDNHKLKLPEDTAINPPVLGNIGEFNLMLDSTQKMPLPKPQLDVTDDTSDMAYDIEDLVDPHYQTERMMRLVGNLETKLKGAQISLWVITGLLFLMLFK